MPCGVDGEFALRLELVSETDRDNAPSRHIGEEQQVRAVAMMRRRVAPAWCRQATGARGARCTSKQQNTHVTESRVVRYRWHPWYGRSVLIVSAFVKDGHAVYRCVLEGADDSRSFEVPQWMVDAAACCRIALSLTPAVSCEALRELCRLITCTCRPDVPAMLQAGYLAITDTGGTCATSENCVPGRSVGPVSPASIDSAVGELAGGSAPASAVAAGTAAARPSSRASRRAARLGGPR
jgi:hypothetical protein